MMNANHDPLAHLATKAELAEVAARLDATLPHLATKADMNRLLMWLIGTLVTCILGFYGLHASLMNNLQREQSELRKEIRQELGELRKVTQSIDGRLVGVEAKLSIRQPELQGDRSP